MAADESKKKRDEEDEKDDDEAADEEESERDEEESDDEESESEEEEESDDEGEDEPEAKKDADEEESDEESEEEESDEEEKASDEESDDEEEEDEEEDEPVSASPEAIAKRVAALGEEDEVEKIAREEERKLAERRRKLKKRGGKQGLALAATKKLKKIGRNARPMTTKRRVPAAVEAADPLLERTAKFGDWAKKNAKTVWTIVGIAAAATIVFAGYTYYERKRAQDASIELAEAIKDEHARIGEAPKDDDDDDTMHYFKTVEDRREAALTKYRNVSAHYSGTGAATLARLGEGSLLLDKRDVDGALAAFDEVKSSPLAAADAEVKGRALEGTGFAHEIQAQAKPDMKDKELDAALAAFKALEATDVAGFKELGMFHQARVLEAKGDLEKAKEMLHQLHDRFAQPDHGHQLDIIGVATDDRLRRLDPTALPPKRVNYGASGHPQLSPEILNQLPPELRAKLMGGGE